MNTTQKIPSPWRSPAPRPSAPRISSNPMVFNSVQDDIFFSNRFGAPIPTTTPNFNPFRTRSPRNTNTPNTLNSYDSDAVLPELAISATRSNSFDVNDIPSITSLSMTAGAASNSIHEVRASEEAVNVVSAVPPTNAFAGAIIVEDTELPDLPPDEYVYKASFARMQFDDIGMDFSGSDQDQEPSWHDSVYDSENEHEHLLECLMPRPATRSTTISSAVIPWFGSDDGDESDDESTDSEISGHSALADIGKQLRKLFQKI